MNLKTLTRHPNAWLLMGLIIQETDNGKQPFRMSIPAISKALNITTKQVRLSLDKLIEWDMLGQGQGQIKGRVEGRVAEYVTLCRLTTYTTLQNQKGQGQGQIKGRVEGRVQGTPFMGENLTQDQRNYNGWLDFYKKNCPHLYTRFDQLTFEQFTKLKKRFNSKILSTAVLNLDNRIDLQKRYSSLYLTLINWCKNEEARQQKGN